MAMLSSVSLLGVTSARADSDSIALVTFTCVLFAGDEDIAAADSVIVTADFIVGVSSTASEDVNSDCEIVHTDQVVPTNSMSRNIANNQPAVLELSAVTW